jgi:hypothetical protein
VSACERRVEWKSSSDVVALAIKKEIAPKDGVNIALGIAQTNM